MDVLIKWMIINATLVFNLFALSWGWFHFCPPLEAFGKLSCALIKVSTNKDLPTSIDSRFGLSIEDITNSDDDFSMIFALKEPYTVSEVAPKIDLAFGTKMSLNANTNDGTRCAISPYYVKTEINITD